MDEARNEFSTLKLALSRAHCGATLTLSRKHHRERRQQQRDVITIIHQIKSQRFTLSIE